MNKEKWIYLLQKIHLKKRDSEFYKKFYFNLKEKIARETIWLNATTMTNGQTEGLPFHEQAIKYYEYKNMIIQRRSQDVIIFLTIVLLIMTGLQIYLTFFK